MRLICENEFIKLQVAKLFETKVSRGLFEMRMTTQPIIVLSVKKLKVHFTIGFYIL